MSKLAGGARPARCGVKKNSSNLVLPALDWSVNCICHTLIIQTWRLRVMYCTPRTQGGVAVVCFRATLASLGWGMFRSFRATLELPHPRSLLLAFSVMVDQATKERAKSLPLQEQTKAKEGSIQAR